MSYTKRFCNPTPAAGGGARGRSNISILAAFGLLLFTTHKCGCDLLMDLHEYPDGKCPNSAAECFDEENYCPVSTNLILYIYIYIYICLLYTSPSPRDS